METKQGLPIIIPRHLEDSQTLPAGDIDTAQPTTVPEWAFGQSILKQRDYNLNQDKQGRVTGGNTTEYRTNDQGDLVEIKRNLIR